MEAKECKRCKKELPIHAFGRASATKDGLKCYCKKCRSMTAQKRYAGNRKPNRELGLKYRYGLTLEQYDLIWEAQEGVCVICGKPEITERTPGVVFSLCVDHDHKTGRIRGLLCRRCNAGLGNFKDSADNLTRAAAYLGRVGLL